MLVIAHAGHWALGLLEAAPLFVVAAFGLWRSVGERRRRHDERDAVALS
jgi:hypothetical protein